MREAFVERNFRQASLDIIDTANDICADYRAQGYNLTLRQVYYQFVARGLLGNSDRNYKTLGSVINDARLAGLVDWSHIQDRTRSVRGGYFADWDDAGEFIDSVVEQYRESLWTDEQQYRPEVWVEKDALVDIVGQACRPLRVPYFSCRGYTSQTAMYDAAKRMRARRVDGYEPIVIHLGDHDPSGIDMTRDITDRLALMSLGDVPVIRVALTIDQVRQYNPPPNPAKLTDSRGSSYVSLYGPQSWELDALEPSVLTTVIQDALSNYVDQSLIDIALAHEEETKDAMRTVASRFNELQDRWTDVEEVLDA